MSDSFNEAGWGRPRLEPREKDCLGGRDLVSEVGEKVLAVRAPPEELGALLLWLPSSESGGPGLWLPAWAERSRGCLHSQEALEEPGDEGKMFRHGHHDQDETQ